MQIQVRRLRELLELLKPAVPKKPTIEALSNILLNDGKAMASDLESAVILDLPEAKEACLVPLDAVIKLLKYVPGNEEITLGRKRGWLNLTWPGGKSSYQVPGAEDYPTIPQVEPKASGSLDGDSLVSALTSVVGYCSSEESRPILSGVTVFLGEDLEVIAADGFRMAYQTLPDAFPASERVIIPAKAVYLLDHLWRKTSKPVQAGAVDASLVEIITRKRQLDLALGDELLSLSLGEATIVTRTIQGEPPDYKQLMALQEVPVVQATVFAPEVERAVRRIKPVAEKGNGAARLILSEDSITVSAKNDEQQVEAEVPTVTTQGTGRVAVNAGYLLDYLQGKDGILTVELRSGTAPVSLRHKSSPLVFIMPMQVDW